MSIKNGSVSIQFNNENHTWESACAYILQTGANWELKHGTYKTGNGVIRINANSIRYEPTNGLCCIITRGGGFGFYFLRKNQTRPIILIL